MTTQSIKFHPTAHTILTPYTATTDITNIYTDTSSNTCGVIENTGAIGAVAFNFSSEDALFLNSFDAIDYNFKIKVGDRFGASSAHITQGSNVSEWSTATGLNTPDTYVTTIDTITLSKISTNNTIITWNDIKNIGLENIQITIATTNVENDYVTIYGIELEVIYEVSGSGTIGSGPFNKITYDGSTLIDLTYDTISADKVLEGVSFHLPSGTPATGTKGAPELHTATATLSSASRTISFSSLIKEPDWYIVVCDSTSSAISTPLAYFADGKGYYYTSTTSSQNVSESNQTGSSSYSNGTLTLTSYNSSTYYFKAATYTLYYY